MPSAHCAPEKTGASLVRLATSHREGESSVTMARNTLAHRSNTDMAEKYRPLVRTARRDRPSVGGGDIPVVCVGGTLNSVEERDSGWGGVSRSGYETQRDDLSAMGERKIREQKKIIT